MEGSCPCIDSSQKNFPKHTGELYSILTKPKTNYPIFLKVSLIHVIKIVLVFFVQECFSMLHWINLILSSSHNINSLHLWLPHSFVILKCLTPATGQGHHTHAP